MSNTENKAVTAEDIQDEYAASKGFETFYHLIMDDKRSLNFHVNIVQKLYAKLMIEKDRERIRIKIQNSSRGLHPWEVGETPIILD